MTISLAKAKSLCNASELALVTASTRQQIGTLSASQLRQKVARTRKLRDKWSDQAQRQRRDVQEKQRARQTSASARSAEKAQLFAEVLERFEKQLAKKAGADTPGKTTTAAAGRKRPPRKVRAKQHRATRAELRESLDQTRREMDAASKTARAKTARAKTATPTEDASATPPPAPSGKKRKQAPGPPSAERTKTSLAALQGLRVSKRQQTRAQTVAKKNRLKAGGNVRIQKHLSAQNKRRQARRDSR